MPFLTMADLVEHVSGYLGKDVSKYGVQAVLHSCQAAIREIQGYHDWAYYRDIGRIVTNASQTTGTVAYDHTGGTYERQLTLTDATWPTWAAYGVVVIDDVSYEVEERKSSTVLTLTEATNPGADVTAGETYVLLRDVYPLPSDFQAMGNCVIASDSVPLYYRHPQDHVAFRRTNMGPSRPSEFSVTSHHDRDGRMAIRLWPAPDSAYQVDFDYRRRPPAATVTDEHAGYVTVTAASASVTGSGTSFGSRHVGAILRIGYDAKNPPTGLSGLYPFVAEHRIKSVESATALTLESAVSESAARASYRISDPVDVELGAMETALYRLAEAAARQRTRMKPISGEDAQKERALIVAREADSRFYGNRGIGWGRGPRRISEMPEDPGQQI